MRRVPIEGLEARVRQFTERGMRAEDLADIIVGGLDRRAQVFLARQYLIELADERAGDRDRRTRRSVTGTRNRRERDERAETGFHERMASLAPVVSRILEDYRESVRAEWTDELLSSSFGRPGGAGRVVWRDATVEDHQAHITQDVNQIDGLGRDVVLHQLAVEDIERAGTLTLGEALAVGVAG